MLTKHVGADGRVAGDRRVRRRRRQRVRDRRLQRRDGAGADIRHRVEQHRWIAFERLPVARRHRLRQGQAVDDPAEGRADLRVGGHGGLAAGGLQQFLERLARLRRADAHAAAFLDTGHLFDLHGCQAGDLARGSRARRRKPAPDRPASNSSRSLANGRRIASTTARSRQDRPDIRSLRLTGGQVGSARPASGSRWRARQRPARRSRRPGRLDCLRLLPRPPELRRARGEQRGVPSPAAAWISVRSAALSTTTSVARAGVPCSPNPTSATADRWP